MCTLWKKIPRPATRGEITLFSSALCGTAWPLSTLANLLPMLMSCTYSRHWVGQQACTQLNLLFEYFSYYHCSILAVPNPFLNLTAWCFMWGLTLVRNPTCASSKGAARLTRDLILWMIIIGHTLVRNPYLCKLQGCTKAFSNSSDLSRHRKTHYDQVRLSLVAQS